MRGFWTPRPAPPQLRIGKSSKATQRFNNVTNHDSRSAIQAREREPVNITDGHPNSRGDRETRESVAGGSKDSSWRDRAEERSALRSGRHKVRQEIGGIRSTQASNGIPSRRGRVPRDRRRLIVADGDIEEVTGVFHRISRDPVESRVDIAEIIARDLIRDGNQAGPLWRTATCPTYDVPTNATGIGAAASSA